MKRLVSQSSLAGMAGVVRITDTTEGYATNIRRALINNQIKNLRLGQVNIIVGDACVIIGIVDRLVNADDTSLSKTTEIHFTDYFTFFNTADGTWTSYDGTKKYFYYDDGLILEDVA